MSTEAAEPSDHTELTVLQKGIELLTAIYKYYSSQSIYVSEL